MHRACLPVVFCLLSPVSDLFCRDRLSCCFGSVDSFSFSQRTVFVGSGCLRTPRPRSLLRIPMLSVVTVTTTTQALQGTRVHCGTTINKCWPRTQFVASSAKTTSTGTILRLQILCPITSQWLLSLRLTKTVLTMKRITVLEEAKV